MQYKPEQKQIIKKLITIFQNLIVVNQTDEAKYLVEIIEQEAIDKIFFSNNLNLFFQIIEQGNIELFQCVLEKLGIDTISDGFANDQHIVTRHAAQYGQLEFVKYIMEFLGPDFLVTWGSEVAIVAIQNNHPEIANYLLDNLTADLILNLDGLYHWLSSEDMPLIGRLLAKIPADSTLDLGGTDFSNILRKALITSGVPKGLSIRGDEALQKQLQCIHTFQSLYNLLSANDNDSLLCQLPREFLTTFLALIMQLSGYKNIIDSITHHKFFAPNKNSEINPAELEKHAVYPVGIQKRPTIVELVLPQRANKRNAQVFFVSPQIAEQPEKNINQQNKKPRLAQ